MKAAIFGTKTTAIEQELTEIFRWFEKNKYRIIVYKPFFDEMPAVCKQSASITGHFLSHKDFPQDSDLMISIGGDGTFLKAVNIVRKSNVPLIGINAGRMGFLATIAKNEILEALDQINNNEYSLEQRSLIESDDGNQSFGDFPFALNEATFQKKGSGMINIHVNINNEFLNSYWADGLIISTPTGSTAYSLGVGGPVMHPQSNGLIIIPIAPHSLTVRPLIVPCNNLIEIKIESRDKQFLATIDSRSVILPVTSTITVKPAQFTIQLIKLNSKNFYATLRNKLIWGEDKRN